MVPFEHHAGSAAIVNAIMDDERPPTLPRSSPTGVSYSILWRIAALDEGSPPSTSNARCGTRVGCRFWRPIRRVGAYLTILNPLLSLAVFTYELTWSPLFHASLSVRVHCISKNQDSFVLRISLPPPEISRTCLPKIVQFLLHLPCRRHKSYDANTRQKTMSFSSRDIQTLLVIS